MQLDHDPVVWVHGEVTYQIIPILKGIDLMESKEGIVPARQSMSDSQAVGQSQKYRRRAER